MFVAGFIGSPAMNLVDARLDDGMATRRTRRQRIPEQDEAVARHRRWAAIPEVARRRHPAGGPRGRRVPVGHARAGQPVVVNIDVLEPLGAEVYVHFSVDAPPVLTDDLQELAADTGADALQALQAAALERRSTFIARMHPRTAVQEGREIDVHVDTRGLHFFDLERGEAIHDRSAAG